MQPRDPDPEVDPRYRCCLHVRVALTDDVRARARAKAELNVGSHDPPLPPASPEDIARSEAALGFSLPEGVADFYSTVRTAGVDFLAS
jgi:hypothetical protein